MDNTKEKIEYLAKLKKVLEQVEKSQTLSDSSFKEYLQSKITFWEGRICK